MKLNKSFSSVIAAFLSICGFNAYAVPAKPGLMQLSTPDGNDLNVRLIGDEFYHQYFTEDGYPLEEKDGYFYYSNLDADGNNINSGIVARNIADRSQKDKDYLAAVDLQNIDLRIARKAASNPRRLELASSEAVMQKAPLKAADSNDGPPFPKGYGLFPSLRFPAYGNQKAIVILVEYQDVKFKSVYDAKEYFTNMLNQDNFNDARYGGTGSAAQYFRENSYGAFVPEFDVYGPITLEHNMVYYGGNNAYGNDSNAAAMVKEACDQLDSIVDFSEYDRDHDGVVDNIFIFYAGMGEASGGGANTVWPHSWNMQSAGYGNLTYDGVRIYTYGCSNEWQYGNRPDGIGTFVHEFSHVMGLPDLYATSYTSSFTPGSWSVLDSGPYNNSSRTPPAYGAFERYALGWTKPREVTGALSAVLEPVYDNVCGLIRTEKDTEFFLLENRQQTGWDRYIPGHGMLVWHVDYNNNVWNGNVVNNTPSHQYVDIEEADGRQSEANRAGDAFPGTSSVRSFTADTNPAMKTWSGTAVNYPITNIVESNGIITFDVLGGGSLEVEPLNAHDATNVRADSFMLHWDEPAEGHDVILNVYTREGNNINYVEGYKNRNVGRATSQLVEGVKDVTTYYYTVTHLNGWFSSAPSAERSVTTTRYTIDYYAVEATDYSNRTDTQFRANWNALNDAVSYNITVYTKELGDPITTETGFDAGTSTPGGWTFSNGVTANYEEFFFNKSVPSLLMQGGSYVITPVYDDYISGFSFWHRGNASSTSDSIDVYMITDEGEILFDQLTIKKIKGGAVVEYSDLPEHTKRIMIKYNKTNTRGEISIDDVCVIHGHNEIPVYMSEYFDKTVGNALSSTIKGLDPTVNYYYTVRATDGQLWSLPSNEIKVPAVRSGINDVVTDDYALSVKGNSIIGSTDDAIMVYDASGLLIGTGAGKFYLTGKGLYIVTVPAHNVVRKIIVK